MMKKSIMTLAILFFIANIINARNGFVIDVNTIEKVIYGIAILLIVVLAIYALNTRKEFRKQNEEIERLKKANSTQKLFLQNMSHEIRTPLNAICGFSQIVCDPQMKGLVSDEELQKYGKIIYSNTDLLTTLVNDILDIGDMESGKYRVNISKCSPNQICKKALNTVLYRCPNNVKMLTTTDLDDNYLFMSDERRVAQVLINFLTNAVKHTNVGKIELHVTDKENPGMVTFSVQDTGEGVPVEKAETIFKRFEKLETFKQGTGLGLAICRNIAEVLNGEVKLDVTYTKGARFVFNLPSLNRGEA